MNKVSIHDVEYSYRYLKDQEVYDYIESKELPKNKKLLGIDIETYARKDYEGDDDAGLLSHKSKIRTLQLYDGHESVILDFMGSKGEYLLSDHELFVKLYEILKSHHLVAHNALFETNHIQRVAYLHDILVPLDILCTMNMYRLIIQAKYTEPAKFRAGLQPVAKMVLGFELPKEQQRSDWSRPELTKEQIDYCALDAILPYLLFTALSNNLEEYGLEDIFILNTKAQEPVSHMNLHGITIDSKHHESMCEDWVEKIAEYEIDCLELLNEEQLDITLVEAFKIFFEKVKLKDIPELELCILEEFNLQHLLLDIKHIEELLEHKELDIKKRRAYRKILKNIDAYMVNPSSSKQLSEWLREHLDEKILENWPEAPRSKNLKTDADAFNAHKELPIVKPISQYKKYTKLYSTYGKGINKFFVKHNKRQVVHPNFSLCFTDTGRMSSFKPNLQNQPARGIGSELRKIFVPRDKNHKLLVADFGQIEIRCAAYISEDPVMINAYKTGQDIHAITASSMSGKTQKNTTEDEWKLLRYGAKAINFGLLFGAGAPTLKKYAFKTYGVHMSDKEAEKAVAVFRETYPGYRKWQKKQAAKIEDAIENKDEEFLCKDSYRKSQTTRTCKGGNS